MSTPHLLATCRPRGAPPIPSCAWKIGVRRHEPVGQQSTLRGTAVAGAREERRWQRQAMSPGRPVRPRATASFKSDGLQWVGSASPGHQEAVGGVTRAAPSGFVRPQYLTQPSFGPAPAAESNDCMTGGSVSTAAAGHRPQPFRFVRHLPGLRADAASLPEGRAGVEQASREETAAHDAVGVARYGVWSRALAASKYWREAPAHRMPMRASTTAQNVVSGSACRTP